VVDVLEVLELVVHVVVDYDGTSAWSNGKTSP